MSNNLKMAIWSAVSVGMLAVIVAAKDQIIETYVVPIVKEELEGTPDEVTHRVAHERMKASTEDVAELREEVRQLASEHGRIRALAESWDLSRPLEDRSSAGQGHGSRSEETQVEVSLYISDIDGERDVLILNWDSPAINDVVAFGDQYTVRIRGGASGVSVNLRAKPESLKLNGAPTRQAVGRIHRSLFGTLFPESSGVGLVVVTPSAGGADRGT